MTQEECAAEWEILKRIIISRIEGINDATPAYPYDEPDWWLEMMRVYRSLTIFSENKKDSRC